MVVRVTTLVSQAGSVRGLAKYPEQALNRSAEIEARRDAGGEVDGAAGYYGSDAAAAFWHGDGAERLGLSGVPTTGQLEGLLSGVGPETGERLGHRFGEKSARGFDATFSVQKEVSVLWAAADVPTRAVIEQAVVDATKAVLDDVARTASTRMRKDANGEFLRTDGLPQVVGAEGPAVAVIPEFTSRKGDPQLHVHAVMSSKVFEPTTERWLALDAREMKMGQRAMSAKFHAGLEAELATKLGVSFGDRLQPYARTINGIDGALLDAFSQRTVDVAAVYEAKLAIYREANGHDPSPQQKWRMERDAAASSRPNKEGEVVHDFDGWRSTIEDITGQSPEQLTAAVTGHRVKVDPVSIEVRGNAAVNELIDSQSSFTRSDLIAELARVQPHTLGTADDVIAQLNADADWALARLPEVTPDSVDPAMRRWSTSGVLNQEIGIFDHLQSATANMVEGNAKVAEFAPEWLDAAQRQAAARVASTSKFEAIVGPAGAGKTSLLKAATETLEAQNRAIFGLGPSAVAAQVLAAETGMDTENVAKFIFEHTQRDGGPSVDFQLPAGATLLVDEAGMVSTPQWATLTNLAQENDWRIVAVGDPFQFSAVGRGGVFDLAVDTLPDHRVTHLEHVHRFSTPWEAEASKQIRAGNTAGLDPYFDTGRIYTQPDADKLNNLAVARYMDLTNQGTETAMFAATNSLVDDLNERAQKARAAAGQLGPKVADGFHVGDLIETRRNNRDLTTDRNEFVKNRDRWTITDATNNGIVATGKAGTVTLPHDYVTDHVNLAYAQTSHGSQGRTINGVGITVIDPEQSPIDRAGLYVPLTRGKESNEVFIAAVNRAAARQHLDDAVTRRFIDTPAISHTLGDRLTSPTLLQEAIDRAANIEVRSKKTLDPPAPQTPGKPTLDELLHPHRTVQLVKDEAHYEHKLAWADSNLEAFSATSTRTNESDLVKRSRVEKAEATAKLDFIKPELAAIRTGTADLLQTDPDILDMFGPRPKIGPERDLWDTGVGMFAQRETLGAATGVGEVGRDLLGAGIKPLTKALTGVAGGFAKRLGRLIDIEPSPNLERGMGHSMEREF